MIIHVYKSTNIYFNCNIDLSEHRRTIDHSLCHTHTYIHSCDYTHIQNIQTDKHTLKIGKHTSLRELSHIIDPSLSHTHTCIHAYIHVTTHTHTKRTNR